MAVWSTQLVKRLGRNHFKIQNSCTQINVSFELTALTMNNVRLLRSRKKRIYNKFYKCTTSTKSI